jgi:large subunit ribosomal protein L22
MATEYKASHRFARTTARKARLVVDMIRGMPVNRALTVLDLSPRRAAVLVGKVVRSAVANAEQDTNVDPNHLTVSVARVDEGPLLGGYLRWRAGSRGRAMPIHKRTSHIHIALAPAAGLAVGGRRKSPGTAGAAAGEAAGAADATGKAGGKKPGKAGKAKGGKAGAGKGSAKAAPKAKHKKKEG